MNTVSCGSGFMALTWLLLYLVTLCQNVNTCMPTFINIRSYLILKSFTLYWPIIVINVLLHTSKIWNLDVLIDNKLLYVTKSLYGVYSLMSEIISQALLSQTFILRSRSHTNKTWKSLYGAYTPLNLRLHG